MSRQDLERILAELRAATVDPNGGIYGPDSLAWEIGRESALFLGGGKAALLQLAHPFVAHAIDQHSKTLSDPLGRFRRTFDGVFRMVFGDLDQAFGAARRVHTVHERVVGVFDEGKRYQANDAEALLWVYATLVATAVEVYDLIVRPLGYAERNRYLIESTRFARLFGVPERLLPADWSDFSRYYRGMLDGDVIRVAEPARRIAGFLFSPRFSVERPLIGWARIMTTGLLPERLRSEFGLGYSDAERRAFRASLIALRAVYPRLPGRLRFVPAYRAARSRLAKSE